MDIARNILLRILMPWLYGALLRILMPGLYGPYISRSILANCKFTSTMEVIAANACTSKEYSLNKVVL